MSMLPLKRSALRLLPADRAALALGLWQLLDHGLGVELYRRLWILALVPTLLMWLIIAPVIVHFASRAFDGSELSKAERYRTALAVPVVSLIVQFISLPPVALPQTIAAQVYLQVHRQEWREAAAKAMAGEPYAMNYVSGVPDGGMAFVHVDKGRPEELPVPQQLRLTGEDIKACRAIIDAWLCGYD